jgi:hypothetical protein
MCEYYIYFLHLLYYSYYIYFLHLLYYSYYIHLLHLFITFISPMAKSSWFMGEWPYRGGFPNLGIRV